MQGRAGHTTGVIRPADRAMAAGLKTCPASDRVGLSFRPGRSVQKLGSFSLFEESPGPVPVFEAEGAPLRS